MRQSHYKLTFESFVLISGIIELSFLIAFQFYQIKLFAFVIKSLQVTIVIFISRRFIYQYNNRDSRNNNSNVHKCYSITFLIANLLFLIAIMYFIMHIDNDINVVIMEYVLYAHSAFGFAVSFVLLIMGVLLLRALNEDVSNVEHEVSFFSSSVHSDVDVDGALVPNNDDSVEVNETRKKEYHKVTKRNISDIYSKTRKLQLLCIVLSNVFSDSVELVIHSLRFFVFEESFIGEQYIEVNDMKGFMVYNAELFSLWLSSFANYLTFYYIVRGSFRTKKATNTVRSSLFRESALLQYRKLENESENKDIQEYLLTNCN